jgi:hypothetical protein
MILMATLLSHSNIKQHFLGGGGGWGECIRPLSVKKGRKQSVLLTLQYPWQHMQQWRGTIKPSPEIRTTLTCQKEEISKQELGFFMELINKSIIKVEENSHVIIYILSEFKRTETWSWWINLLLNSSGIAPILYIHNWTLFNGSEAFFN